jgi:PHD/YefM family antitoxin component YafN of YafNO toxin-antitoxin module
MEAIMKIHMKSIVSSSYMTKNYKGCREKAEDLGKIFVFKSNKPDAVLFSIDEYKKLSIIIQHLELLNDKDLAKVMEPFTSD